MLGFIITLVVLILIKFIYDSAKQSGKIKSEGGIRNKYSILINHLLEGHPDCRIYQETNTFVSVGVSSAAGSTMYYIFPSYGNVTIRMEIKNNPLLGNVNKEWKFPENMNQEDMMFKISSDIEQMMLEFSKRFE